VHHQRLLTCCVAVCCSVLQCVAVCCNVLQCVAICCSVRCSLRCSVLHSSKCVHALHVCCRCTLKRSCTHLLERNTLQHTATHCNTLQHIATHCNTLQHTATHCNTLHVCCRCTLERSLGVCVCVRVYVCVCVCLCVCVYV